MIQYGGIVLEKDVSTRFTRLLKNIYSNTLLGLKLPLGMTTFSSKFGLKQGCSLSPILFNLFINDVIDGLMMPIEGTPYLQGTLVNCLFYVDDVVLRSESKNGLQDLLDKLHQYSLSWFLQINPKKTRCDINEI